MSVVYKLFLILPFSISLAYAQDAAIHCSSSVIQGPNLQAKVVELAQADEQFQTVFTGEQGGAHFQVVVDKNNLDLNGSIQTPQSVTISSTGKFNSEGRFEFSTMAGGSEIMPGEMYAISCTLKP